MTQQDALLVILARRRPLPGSGHHWTQPRDPARNPDVLKRDLARAYVEWRMQAHRDDSRVVSVRQTGSHAVIRVSGWGRV